ncbi:MAG TPA: FHA domain-containing protein, partial [Lachnospiraceae bacterium]|nr:FHA domain-containing protein [Lachnospiraceae bacterium]
VSKRHAILEEVNGKIHIRDLSSTNGTFVNGELITNNSSYPLSDKDKITLANITYQLIKIS